jgi:hypothetical protein
MSSSSSLNIIELLGFRAPPAAILAVFAAVGWLRRQLRNLTCDARWQAVESTSSGRVNWITSCGGFPPCKAWGPVLRLENGRHVGSATIAAWHLVPRVPRWHRHACPDPPASWAENTVHGPGGRGA